MQEWANFSASCIVSPKFLRCIWGAGTHPCPLPRPSAVLPRLQFASSAKYVYSSNPLCCVPDRFGEDPTKGNVKRGSPT